MLRDVLRHDIGDCHDDHSDFSCSALGGADKEMS